MKHLAFVLSINLTLFSIITPNVQAWGKEGHAIVANIAYNLLTPNTKQAASYLLFPSDDFNSTDDTSPLAAVASWADKVRYTKYFSWTTPLHYVDVQDGLIPGGCPATSTPERITDTIDMDDDSSASNCTFVYKRDCKGGRCAVRAIVEFAHLSQYPSNGVMHRQKGLRRSMSFDGMHDVTQRQSLMFLIHIIGDIHQPLHVSRKSDIGGNTINVSFPEEFGGFRDERFGHAHKGWNLQ